MIQVERFLHRLLQTMSRNNNERIIGVIYPILPLHLHRILKENKDVFVKLGKIPKKLLPDSRLFFYESKRNKEIVAEAKIISMDRGTPQEVYERYSNRLFLNKNELEKYVEMKRTKVLIVLNLKNIKKYNVPLRIGRSVTMAGQYMTKGLYDKLRAKKHETRTRF